MNEDELIIIDAENREIIITGSQYIFGVFQDSKAERKFFKCPRYVGDGIDLYKCHIFVNYLSAGGNYGKYLCEDVAVIDDDYITFSWVLAGNIFDANEETTVQFSIQAYRYTSGSNAPVNVFNTRPAFGLIYSTIECGDYVEEERSDLVTELMASYEKFLAKVPNIGYNENWFLGRDDTGIPARGIKGEVGTTYTPSVSDGGLLTWENDGGLPNPPPVNIKGPRGDGIGVNGLSVVDGKLYLTKDGTIVSNGITIPSGGGSGGSSGAITLVNELQSNKITVSSGQTSNLRFTYSSTEDSEAGTGYLYVNSILKTNFVVQQGSNIVDVSEYLGDGTNTVKILCSDIYANEKSLIYTVEVVNLRITSNFDDSLTYNGDISYRYTPYGAVLKTIHFKLDGIELPTVDINTSGRAATKTIPAQSHGLHTLEVWSTANIDGFDISSSVLKYGLICVSESGSSPIISSANAPSTVNLGEMITIPFTVYDPSSINAEIELTISSQEGIFSSQTRTVDRTRQLWQTRNYPSGNVNFTLTCGSYTCNHSVIVTGSEIEIYKRSSDLEFELTSDGKSNSASDFESWSNNGVTTTFQNMNWAGTGWIADDAGDVALHMMGDARAVINFSPFSTDARLTGRTIEFIFAIRDVNNRDARPITCKNGNIGFVFTADTATISSEQSKVDCRYRDNDKLHVAFVIESRSDYRMLQVYLNGILSQAVQYPLSDNFQQSTPSQILIGSNYCAIDLYCVRSYSAALSESEVRDNYISSITNYAEKLSTYQANQIYDTYGTISYDKLKSKIPTITITGPLPQSKGDKKKVNIKYVHPFTPSLNFDDDCTIDVQGTSSQWYVRKNYKLKFATEHQHESGMLPAKVFCVKADYAESTGTHNTGNANYAHVLYDYKTPPQQENEGVRTTIYGFPIVIFHKSDTSSDPEFIGKYNFNYDKGAENVFGFTVDYPSAESWEFLNNTSEMCLFRGEIDSNYLENFESRYPEDAGIENFKMMHDWVVSTCADKATNLELAIPDTINGIVYNFDTAEYRIAKFKDEFENHFDKESCVFYYVFTLFALMVDQRAKNMFLTTFDGQHWAPWLYDNDTSYGINNEGSLVFDYYHEDIDTLEAANVYNGQNSTLWVNFREAYADDIKAFYQKLRSDKKLSYDNVIEYLVNRQSDKWPISVYNEDADYKYISMLRSDNDASNLPQIRGSGEAHLKYFVSNRLKYLDSKFYATDYANDYVALRIYTPSGSQAIEPNANITITPYSNMYLGVRYKANGSLMQQRAEKNEDVTFVAPNETFNDTETGIYGASEISSLGDLAPLYAGSVNVSNATKLTELKVGDGTTGYSNPNLTNLSVGTNHLLKKIDVRNCPKLTQVLELSNCPSIEEIYAEGTGITGVELPQSGYLKVIHLPGTLTNLTILNQPNLSELTIDGSSNLTTLRIENVSEAVDSKIIAENMPLGSRIRILDINWVVDDSQILNRMKQQSGLDQNGNNTSTAVLTGSVRVGTAILSEYVENQDVFQYLVITADSIDYDLLSVTDNDSIVDSNGYFIDASDYNYSSLYSGSDIDHMIEVMA